MQEILRELPRLFKNSIACSRFSSTCPSISVSSMPRQPRYPARYASRLSETTTWGSPTGTAPAGVQKYATPAFRGVRRIHGRRRGTQDNTAPAARQRYFRHVARVVARVVLRAERMLVLLVNDNQSQVPHRRKDGAARSHDDVDVALPDALPLVKPFPRRRGRCASRRFRRRTRDKSARSSAASAQFPAPAQSRRVSLKARARSVLCKPPSCRCRYAKEQRRRICARVKGARISPPRSAAVARSVPPRGLYRRPFPDGAERAAFRGLSSRPSKAPPPLCAKRRYNLDLVEPRALRVRQKFNHIAPHGA